MTETPSPVRFPSVSLQRDFADGFFDDAPAPCLSLYQPTHRHLPEKQQNPIRFRNLVKQLEASLARHSVAAVREDFLRPFRELAEDPEFWNDAQDGLAVLAAPGRFRVYRLERAVPELAVVADSFHVKPLLRIQQSADRFQVLALTRGSIRLFEGNRDQLREVDPGDGVPRTLEEALGSETTEPHRTVASYGTGARGAAMHHGHGGRNDEVEIDTERFFRAVDRGLSDQSSRGGGLPVVLAGVAEQVALYRRLSRLGDLVDQTITQNPERMSADDLRPLAWQAFEPRYLERLERLKETFQEAHAKESGSADVAELARAAVAGRVATLLIEAEKQVPGRIEADTGQVHFGELDDPGHDDLLDDLAELTRRNGGEVVVVPAERMPVETGAAGVFRF